jgi:hypothetical protein
VNARRAKLVEAISQKSQQFPFWGCFTYPHCT